MKITWSLFFIMVIFIFLVITIGKIILSAFTCFPHLSHPSTEKRRAEGDILSFSPAWQLVGLGTVLLYNGGASIYRFK